MPWFTEQTHTCILYIYNLKPHNTIPIPLTSSTDGAIYMKLAKHIFLHLISRVFFKCGFLEAYIKYDATWLCISLSCIEILHSSPWNSVVSFALVLLGVKGRPSRVPFNIHPYQLFIALLAEHNIQIQLSTTMETAQGEL